MVPIALPYGGYQYTPGGSGVDEPDVIPLDFDHQADMVDAFSRLAGLEIEQIPLFHLPQVDFLAFLGHLIGGPGKGDPVFQQGDIDQAGTIHSFFCGAPVPIAGTGIVQSRGNDGLGLFIFSDFLFGHFHWRGPFPGGIGPGAFHGQGSGLAVGSSLLSGATGGQEENQQ